MNTFNIILFAVLILFYAAIIGISIASYVLNAIGLSRVAAKKGISNPWLAWIPLANLWVLGSTADRIDAERGLERQWGKGLLGLYIAFLVTFIPAYIGVFAFIFTSALFGNSSVMASSAFVIFIISYIILIASVFLSLIAQAFHYICLYKLFESFVPEKSVKYFVLSIVVPLAMGICLMKCCPKKQEQILPDPTEI